MQMEQGWMVDVMMKGELWKVIWRLATTQWVVDAIMGSFGLRGKEADAASARGISMEYNKFFFTLKGKSFFWTSLTLAVPHSKDCDNNHDGQDFLFKIQTFWHFL